MRPQIGYEYRLDINKDHIDDAIAWVTNKKRPIHLTLGEIDGKIVKVKSISKINSSKCLVALSESPGLNFYIPRSYLMAITTRVPIQCGCKLNLLISLGCQCGAIDKERAEKKK